MRKTNQIDERLEYFCGVMDDNGLEELHPLEKKELFFYLKMGYLRKEIEEYKDKKKGFRNLCAC